jgi:hypothetical protein
MCSKEDVMNFEKLNGNFANVNGKLANVNGMVAKVLTVGFLAGAVVLFAPEKAQAQEVFIGGGPYARHDLYERERIEAFRRHEAFERRQAFIRHEEFRRFHHDRFYR